MKVFWVNVYEDRRGQWKGQQLHCYADARRVGREGGAIYRIKVTLK